MKTKHTPKPWNVGHYECPIYIDTAKGPEEYDETGYSVYFGPDGEEETIATLPFHTDQAEKSALANAHLMAAAPELLEACQLVALCKRGGHLPAKTVIKLMEAIAKATDI